MSFHNTEIAILSAIQLRSTGGEWSPRPDANGVKNITIKDPATKQKVPFIGDFISFKLAIIRKYEWKGVEREDAGMYGQEVFFDLPINELYANEKGKYEGLLNAIVPEDEAVEGDFKFTQGFAFKNKSFDATLTDWTSPNTGKLTYFVFKIEDAGKAKPPVKLDVANIKQSSNTASVLAAILAKRSGAKTPPAATDAAPAKQEAPVAKPVEAKADDIPWGG
jgi:hypothetical protein